MLRLRAFGTVHVADSEGVPLTGAAGQRRVLAFLSVLVVAGDGGLSRDKVAALLWPESDAERARHSVTQALYAARRALSCDDLFDAGTVIRLNRARLSSDVQEFEAALAADELERAVALYEGPFLDGFYFPGSPEFEQWISSRREHYADRLAQALRQLALRAEERQDFRGAAEWRKRLAGMRPLDSATTVELMTALAHAGDRAGALRHAEIHATLLREELGIEPDGTVTRLAARLRDPMEFSSAGESRDAAMERRGQVATPSAESGVADERSSANEPPTADEPLSVHERSSIERASPDSAVSEPELEQATDRESRSQEEILRVPSTLSVEGTKPSAPVLWRASFREFWSGSRNRRTAGIAGVLVLAVLVVMVSVWGLRREPAAPAAPVEAPLRQTVVVAPFRVSGATEALGYLREGLVELLSARLADDTAARSVDAGAVLSAWRKAGFARDEDLPRATVVRLAASLGAERVVIGSVVGSSSRAILNATVVSVPTGAVAGTASVEGPADSVTMLVDRLAARLLVQVAGEDNALAEQTTASLPALRSFLAGQAAFHRHDYDAAQRAYERALRSDTTFALAALQLVRSTERLQSAEHRGRTLGLAWLGRAALSERDQSLLLTMTGPRFPAPSTAAEQVATWERPTRLFPERADSWYELGARLYHEGAVVGLARSRARADSALNRALSIDSTYSPVRSLVAHIAADLSTRSVNGATSLPTVPHDSVGGPFAPFVRWRVALAAGDSAALRRVRETMLRLGRANLRAIAQAGQFDVVGLADSRLAIDILRSRAERAVDRLEVAEAAHSLSLNEGRLREVETALDRIGELQPGSRASQRLRVLNALYGDGDRARGAQAAALLARSIQATALEPLVLRVEQDFDACVLGQWKLSHDDTAGVTRIVQALRDVRSAPSSSVAATPAGLCADLLDASLAVTLRQPNAAETVARIDSLALTPATSGDASTYAPILIARLHERIGDVSGALAAVRKRTYMVGWPRYLATALREEGRYAIALGDRVTARAAYERHLILRARSDTTLVAERDSVRRELAAIRAN